MRHRPWPILVIGILHFIEPLIKGLFWGIISSENSHFYWHMLFSYLHPLRLAEYFFLFPFAGLCLLLVKKWSYFLFIFIHLYSFTKNLGFLVDLYNHGHYYSLMLIILAVSTNLALVLYFLLTEVKRPFMDKSLRWWESSTRFQIEFPIECFDMDFPERKVVLKSVNVSRIGLGIKEADGIFFKVGGAYMIDFHWDKFHFFLEGRAIHRFMGLEGPLWGIQFLNLSLVTRWKLYSFTQCLKKKGIPHNRNRGQIVQKIITFH